ncbi:Retrovirus-related Pol polyprotein from type-1 retrotransposable element R1 4, partial [Stegodyphus mimosarum]
MCYSGVTNSKSSQKNFLLTSYVKLNAQRIKLVNTLKYQGVTFDTKMTRNPYNQNLKLRTSAIAKQMRQFYRYNWGLNQHMQKVLYTTVVEKVATYAAAIWYHTMQGRKIKQLYTIQRPFALGITRAYHTTSSNVLNVSAGLLPLHI